MRRICYRQLAATCLKLSMNRRRMAQLPHYRHCEAKPSAASTKTVAGSDASVHAGVAKGNGLPHWPSLRGAQRRGSRDDDWEIAGSWSICSLRGRKQAALHEHPPNGTAIPPRHCEERSDAAVHGGVAERHGSPRFARDDDWEIAGSWSSCSLRGRKQAARDDGQSCALDMKRH